MAIEKEIWANEVQEGMFGDNTFMSRSVDASQYVTGKKVHWPQAGASSNVKKNRAGGRTDATSRDDSDLVFDIDNYSTDPKYVKNAEESQLSYNKVESIVRMDKATLHENVADGMVLSWLPDTATLKTTGAAVVAHTSGATGNRKGCVAADVRALMTYFDKKRIPQAGRCLLLDAEMYGQLLESLTTSQAQAFHASIDVEKGTMGKLYGFDVYKRSTVGVYGADGSLKEIGVNGLGTDCGAGLAWHEGMVARAAGEVKAYVNEEDAEYYGTVMSFDVNAGGACINSTVGGVCSLVQALTA